ncbi:MAG TPA: antitoxin MazE family protein [Gammaproteobacteria bacterium]
MRTKRKTAREHVSTYRSRMKTRGLRQVNLWLPDTRSPEFKKECRRQSLLVGAAERTQPLDALLNTAAGSVEGWT